MKIHDRKCANPECSNILESTRTRSDVCIGCTNKAKSSAKANEQRAVLEAIGYTNIQDPAVNKFKQRIWTFTHPSCGKEQTWTFGNLQTRLKKDPDNVPCSFCGAKRRTENMNG